MVEIYEIVNGKTPSTQFANLDEINYCVRNSFFYYDSEGLIKLNTYHFFYFKLTLVY